MQKLTYKIKPTKLKFGSPYSKFPIKSWQFNQEPVARTKLVVPFSTQGDIKEPSKQQKSFKIKKHYVIAHIPSLHSKKN